LPGSYGKTCLHQSFNRVEAPAGRTTKFFAAQISNLPYRRIPFGRARKYRPGDFGGRVLITVDGHRMNDPIFDSAASGPEAVLDVDMIERVEIIRGPGSALYGNNAFLAVINAVTRRGKDIRGAELSGAAASYDSYVWPRTKSGGNTAGRSTCC
jgi:outer membrane receptor protein involved in Fe transport